MRFTWVESPQTADRPCPVCGDARPKGVLLTVEPGGGERARLRLLGCAACGSAFYDDLSPPAYDAVRSGEGFLKFYVELGAGLDTMLDPLYRIDRAGVRTCLEIGCGFGFSLDFARFAFGWAVKGMDPSPLAAAGRKALNLDIVSGYLGADTDFGARFDAVLCSEVIEHLPAPAELVRRLARTVSEDGALILTTPNARALRRETPAGTMLSVLAPGFHLILYSPESLEKILKENGFAHVRVWERADSLHAVATHRPRPLHDVAAVDPDLFRRYLRTRAAEAPPDSPAASGFSCRLFKALVAAGRFREADDVYRGVRDRILRGYGIDVDAPSGISLDTAKGLSLEEFARCCPFNLASTLYFKGMCEFLDGRDFPRAVEYFRAAAGAGLVVSAVLCSASISDCETENVVCQARIHTLFGLAAVDAAAAVDEFLRIGGPPAPPGPGERPWRLPASLVDATRRELFIRLVQRGACREAGSLLPGVIAVLPAASKLPAQLRAALQRLDPGPAVGGSPARPVLHLVAAPLARLRLSVAVDNLAHDRHDDLSASWLGTVRALLSALGRRLRRNVRGAGP